MCRRTPMFVPGFNLPIHKRVLAFHCPYFLIVDELHALSPAISSGSLWRIWMCIIHVEQSATGTTTGIFVCFLGLPFVVPVAWMCMYR